MAHYAQVINGIVKQVLVIDNSMEDTQLEEGCINWLNEYVSNDGNWLKTSYNGSIRLTFAKPGYEYNAEQDIFHAPQPHLHWELDRNTGEWLPPMNWPGRGDDWEWVEDDSGGNWVKVSNNGAPMDEDERVRMFGEAILPV